MSHRTGRGDARIALAWLVCATAVGSFGLAAGGSAGALVATHLSGSGTASGLPLTALATGSALSILAVARLTRRVGRQSALAAGYGLGALGALLVIVATARSHLGLVLVGSLLLGGPNAAVFLTRYAAADLVPRHQRGRALGLVLGSVTVGAVGGSYLLGPTAVVAAALGLAPIVGLYLLAVPAFLTAGLVLAQLGGSPAPPPRPRERRVRDVLRGPGPARRAAVLLAIANLAMTSIMVVIPVHLTDHGHGLHLTGGLVGLHVAGMFCPSPFTGWLADRIGGDRLGGAGLTVLGLTAGGWAVTATTGAFWSGVLLVTLGVGWNAAVVGGSALLGASTTESDRIDAEAGAELAKEAGAFVGAPLAGVATVVFGFPVLCLLVGLACAIGFGVARSGVRPSNTAERRAGRPSHPGPTLSRTVPLLRPPVHAVDDGTHEPRNDVIEPGGTHVSKRSPS